MFKFKSVIFDSQNLENFNKKAIGLNLRRNLMNFYIFEEEKISNGRHKNYFDKNCTLK